MYFSQDRVTVAEGRMADPDSPDEMVATAEAAQLSGWHLGETIPFDAYSLQQADEPDFNPSTGKPAARFSAKLVGLVVFSSQVVDDDVDRFPTDVLATPALTRRLDASATYPTYGLRLDGGSNAVAAVEREIVDALPPGSTYSFHLTSVVEGEVERATKPEAIALGVFGIIAALAALLIAGQAISRRLWASGRGPRHLAVVGGRQGDEDVLMPCSDHSAPSSSAPSSPSASPWRSRLSYRSARHARSTRHRGLPPTGPSCSQASPCSASDSDSSPSAWRTGGPRFALANDRSSPENPGWSRSQPAPVSPNQRSPVCASPFSEAAVGAPCPCARRLWARH